ncbi:amylosucrase [Halenospora varia]|nr:amylosucrase [Halenospora varia]
MNNPTNHEAFAALAHIKDKLSMSTAGAKVLTDRDFLTRLDLNFITLYIIFLELYGHREDVLDQLADLLILTACSWCERPKDLKSLDQERELNPEWFLSNKMLGGVAYVDRYAQDLTGLRSKIPYFKDLGLTYLHLLPVFDCPKIFNDGGYAVSDYRKVKPDLGTIEDLRDLATGLRRNGISLVLDMIFNHTSDEHEWAKKAEAGEPEHSAFYWMFPDRSIPDEFEKTTREIFPDDHRGSFIRLPDGRWVWSTFYHFQWDLNYSNPAVFRAMAGELLFLSNLGVEVFRMDAVAFVWKQMSTACENLPEAHKILRAFNFLCRIAAPLVVFKSEAIVHPDEVKEYISPQECQISYNPLQMALTWEALATRDVSMLSQALERRHNLPRGCVWVNYVRSHDDIGWTFSDEDAGELGIDGFSHRRFLNSFFVNRHPGSFARGMPFQDNPRTGDCRISGTTASLAGLESGEEGAVGRILLAYSIAMSTGGVPLIYLGDEVGILNDYSYVNDPSHRNDSRWVHRPTYPADEYALRDDHNTIPGRVFAGITQLIKLRKSTEELKGGRSVCFCTGNKHVLGYLRLGPQGTVLCLANFSDFSQHVTKDMFSDFVDNVKDLIMGGVLHVRTDGVKLKAHQYVWLRYEQSK